MPARSASASPLPLVVIAGGGTGGHVFPALAVARELVAMGARAEFIGTERGFEARLVPREGFLLHTLPVRGVAGKPLPARLLALALLPVAVIRALLLLLRLRPRAVLGVGGFASGPALLAAWTLRIPIVIHEQNALPGWANRLGARLARAVAVSFPSTSAAFPRGAVVTGNPVREVFFGAPGVQPRDPVRLLVFGGSQGSHVLNLRVTEALAHLKGTRIGIVHQTGERDLEMVRRAYAASSFRGAVVVPFLDDLPREAAGADLVIARAGATTVAELAACGRPAILVPFAAATGHHQEANARALAEAGGAEVILESAITGELLAERIRTLAAAPHHLEEMGARARSLARPDAARALARLVLEQAGIATPG